MLDPRIFGKPALQNIHILPKDKVLADKQLGERLVKLRLNPLVLQLQINELQFEFPFLNRHAIERPMILISASTPARGR